MAGMEPSMDEVQQEMQNVVLAGPVKERADRTMRAIREKNPTILASPENLKLTAALQSLGVQRINGAVFGAWSEKLKHEESVEHPIYIQLKDNQLYLDKTLWSASGCMNQARSTAASTRISIGSSTWASATKDFWVSGP